MRDTQNIPSLRESSPFCGSHRWGGEPARSQHCLALVGPPFAADRLEHLHGLSPGVCDETPLSHQNPWIISLSGLGGVLVPPPSWRRRMDEDVSSELDRWPVRGQGRHSTGTKYPYGHEARSEFIERIECGLRRLRLCNVVGKLLQKWSGQDSRRDDGWPSAPPGA
jgi:hypothetical protein